MRSILYLGLVALVCCAFGPAQAGGNVDMFLGQKELDTNFGGGTDMQEQDALALLTDWGGDGWPVHIAFDVLWGNQDTDDDSIQANLDGSTGEIDLGVRWYPVKDSKWMPHLGGGLGLISGEVDADFQDPNAGEEDFSFDDSALGYWADTGLAYRIGDHFKLGGRVRWSEAKLDNPIGAGETEEVDAGGLSYGVNAGWTW
jgi:opacity protein-like surface antigen